MVTTKLKDTSINNLFVPEIAIAAINALPTDARLILKGGAAYCASGVITVAFKPLITMQKSFEMSMLNIFKGLVGGDVKFVEQSASILVTSGKSKFLVPAMQNNDIFVPEFVKPISTLDNPGAFAEAIDCMALASAGFPDNDVANCIHSDGVGHLDAISQTFIVRKTIVDKLPICKIPLSTINYVAKLNKAGLSPTAVHLHNGHILFYYKGFAVASQLIVGDTFANTHKIIGYNEEQKPTVTFSPELYHEALLIASKDKDVLICIRSDKLMVRKDKCVLYEKEYNTIGVVDSGISLNFKAVEFIKFSKLAKEYKFTSHLARFTNKALCGAMASMV